MRQQKNKKELPSYFDRTAGIGYENVLKTTVYLTDIKDLPELNKIYRQYFKGDFPARAAFQVGGLAKGAVVEIEAIADVTWKKPESKL